MVCWSRAQVVEAAARAGHLSVLKFLLRFEVSARLKQDQRADVGIWNMVYFGGDDTYEAAKNGYSEFLHDLDQSAKLHRSERGRKLEATSVAMDAAAERGHVEVVKWLHEHRSKGCTTAAMDLAAAWGHLNVVKRLHATRSEGCTSNAMDYAAANGHLEVVQFLHTNRSEGCTLAALEEATTNSLRRGDLPAFAAGGRLRSRMVTGEQGPFGHRHPALAQEALPSAKKQSLARSDGARTRHSACVG
ncbi:hypothetical protein BBJ28_00016866 [Nothophytophthora sp. Chile5]|nr:hypothetical protein BBJ28_00016866 [Nothophytophthora sp. Chile5]